MRQKRGTENGESLRARLRAKDKLRSYRCRLRTINTKAKSRKKTRIYEDTSGPLPSSRFSPSLPHVPQIYGIAQAMFVQRRSRWTDGPRSVLLLGSSLARCAGKFPSGFGRSERCRGCREPFEDWAVGGGRTLSV